jgi:hypothetical protein
MTRARALWTNGLFFFSLSTHLDGLARRISEVEEASCGILTDPSALNGHDAITKFQALDFVRQALEDCAVLVHHMALEQGADNSQYLGNSQMLRAKLKLEATQSLLTPKLASGKKRSLAQDGGIDLF